MSQTEPLPAPPIPLRGHSCLSHLFAAPAVRAPITDSILDHDLLGPLIRQGMKEGGLNILRLQAAKRFGPLPDWAEERLETLSYREIEDLAVRLLDAKTIQDLFTR